MERELLGKGLKLHQFALKNIVVAANAYLRDHLELIELGVYELVGPSKSMA